MDERIKWSRLPRNTEASRFLSARQIAQNQTLSKKKKKKHNAMPMTRGKDKRLTWGPFLKSPGKFSGPKSNIQIEI